MTSQKLHDLLDKNHKFSYIGLPTFLKSFAFVKKSMKKFKNQNTKIDPFYHQKLPEIEISVASFTVQAKCHH